MNVQSDRSLPVRQIRWLLSCAAAWVAAAGAVCVAWLVSIPADPKNSVLLGFSAARLAVLALLLGGLLGAVFMLVWANRRAERTAALFEGLLSSTRGLRAAVLAALVILLLGWLGTFWPLDRIRAVQSYLERLRPFLVWLMNLGAAVLIGLLWAAWRRFPQRLRGLVNGRSLWTAAALGLALFGLVGGVVVFTGLGVWPGNAFWNKVGVPLVSLQILLAWALAMLLVLLLGNGKLEGRRLFWLDLLIGLVLWAAAASLWSSTPLAPSHFNTQPYPPNYESYPFSDAMVYDRTAQNILIGKGITRSTDKVYYIFLLSLLNWLGGSSYQRVITLQVVLLAVLPVLLYWLGKELHSRPLGLMVAVLAIFKELNAIAATNIIQVSHSRMLLTEMPTTVGVVLFAVFMARWLRQTSNLKWLLAAGGMLGLTALIRLNALLLAPFALLLLWLALGRRWKLSFVAGILFVALMLTSMAPWMVRNQYRSGNALQSVMGKVRGVIINNRYLPILNRPMPTPQPGLANNSAPREDEDSLSNKNGAAKPSLGTSITAHFFHNLLSVWMIVPPVVEHENVLQTIRAVYWDSNWDGTLVPGGAFALAGLLLIEALGMGALWMRSRTAGLLPVLILIGYSISDAFSLTSGGRYIVPADWTIYFYFAAGLLELTLWAAALVGLQIRVVSPAVPAAGRLQFSGRALAGLVVLFLLLGGLPPLWERVFAPRYPQSAAQVLETLWQQGDLQSAGLDAGKVKQFLQQPKATLLYGRALYPRYYAAGDKDTGSLRSVYGARPYSRLMFLVIGPQSDEVLMPVQASPKYFPHGVDALVLGCAGEDYTTAVVVILPGEPATLLQRAPQTDWTCPLPEPVCAENGQCR